VQEEADVKVSGLGLGPETFTSAASLMMDRLETPIQVDLTLQSSEQEASLDDRSLVQK
jgi:hypothetical protein